MFDVAYYHLPDDNVYHVIHGHALTSIEMPELDNCQGFIVAPFSSDKQSPYVLIQPTRMSEHHVPARVKHFEQKWTEMENKALYRDNFKDIHSLLAKGILDKVVLARRTDCRVDSWNCTLEQLFRKACVMYPSQMTVMFRTEATGTWLMSTPEILLKEDNNRWMTMALAGTRHGNASWAEKEIREQRIVEDYISKAIAPFANDIVKSKPYTSTAAALLHRRTDFSFKIQSGVSVNQLVEALYPTPAVCGLPKDRAIGAIKTYESIDRRYYSGFCGPWNVDGKKALYVSLRCMEIGDDRDFRLYAGGGLLDESDARSEWNETEDKMDTMRNVLR